MFITGGFIIIFIMDNILSVASQLFKYFILCGCVIDLWTHVYTITVNFLLKFVNKVNKSLIGYRKHKNWSDNQNLVMYVIAN